MECGSSTLVINSSSCSVSERSLGRIHFKTEQGLPGPVRNVTIVAVTPYSALLTWLRPDNENGLIDSYFIRIRAMNRHLLDGPFFHEAITFD